jgi:acetyl esterase/lipase
MTTTESDPTRVGPPPPFDPELAAALETMPELPRSVTIDLIPVMRSVMAERDATDEDLARGGAFEVSQRTAPGPHGDIPLLVVRPAGATTQLPALYYVHGGGMVMGTNRGADSAKAFDLAAELGLVIVSVDYRLAPEHPHPVPVDECYAGLEWTVEHAEELGVDPERIVVAGASAGGGLAAAVALLARDRNGPALAAQLLFCPMLDDRNESASARQMVGLGVWDRASNDLGWTALLGDERGGPDVSPYAAPPGRRTCPACRPPTSTSAPRRRSATRSWRTRRRSGRRAARPSCTCGRAGSTGSSCWPRRRCSRGPRPVRGPPGCGGCSGSEPGGRMNRWKTSSAG